MNFNNISASFNNKYKKADPSSYEAETIAYMDEVGIPDDSNLSIYGITNSQVWNAVNDFVVSLKTNGLYTKSFKIFPKLGNSAMQQAIDLVNPLTPGTYAGSWVFDQTGAVANGTNCYFDTGFNPSVNSVAQNDIGATINAITVGAGGNSYPAVFGARTTASSTARFQIYLKYNGNINRLLSYIGLALLADYPATSTGIHTITRMSEVGYHYRESTFLDSISQSGTTVSDAMIYEGAANNYNTNVAEDYFQGTLGISAYHKHLTATDVNNLHSAINLLETTLNRI